MTPQTQAFLHDLAAGVRGDCHRTALACLLGVDRDDVPHTHVNSDRDTRALIDAYLEPMGWRYVDMPMRADDLATAIGWMRVTNPGVAFVICGESPRGMDHACVVSAKGVFHDPHPSRGGLVGPCGDGLWWIGLVVKL